MTRPDWRSKFDLVVSLCYVGNRDRVPSLDAELERVGLSVDLRIWNVPMLNEVKLLPFVPAVNSMRVNRGFLNSGFGHYRAWLTMRGLEARRMLVIEDDVRFLTDLGALSAVVAELPDADICLFDLLRAGHDDPAAIKAQLDSTRRGTWAEPTDRPCSFACYALNARGAGHLIGCFEGALNGRWKLHIVDHYMHGKWRTEDHATVACAWPLAAIQVPFAASPSNTATQFGGGNPDTQLDWYRSIGIDPADYGGGR